MVLRHQVRILECQLNVRVAYRPVDRAILGCYSVTPKDTLATFGCARHTGNGSYCVALDDLLAHADEAPGTCAEPFEMAARLRSAAFKQQGNPCFRCHLNVS